MFHESDLLENERNKYSRQVIVPGMGIENQIKLRNSSVLVVGCGGLGSPLIMYLASCGISKLGIVDHDKVEIHNLQRQVIYKEEDVGKYKVDCAFKFIKDMNNTIEITKYNNKFDACSDYINDYDIIVDCTDNINARYNLSDAAKKYQKDFICASVIRWEGHLYVFKREGPCYRCIYPKMKQTTVSCDESGIIGPICGIFGSFLGLEIIKLILGLSNTKLIRYNGFNNVYNNFKLRSKSPNCLTCNNKTVEDPKVICSSSIISQSYENIPRKQWTEVLQNFDDFFIIDVRSNLQYRMYRIKNSINIPLIELKERLCCIDTSKKVIVLCKRGISSLRGAEILLDRGIDCFSLDGGIDAYENYLLSPCSGEL